MLKNRTSLPLTLLPAVAVLVLVFALQLTAPVSAQCKEPSTCKTCHEVQGQFSVRDQGDWHSQHAAFDFCAVCHSGNRKAKDAATAHTGMYLTLSEMSGTCQNCHAADLEDCLNSYASQLGVDAITTLNAAKAANPNAALSQYLGAQTSVNPKPKPAASTADAPPAEANTANTGNRILAAFLLVGTLGGGGFVLWNERRLRGTAPAVFRPGVWLSAVLRREFWSPYAAGVLLGLVGIGAVWGGSHLVGASGAVSTISSSILSAVAPAAVGDKMYFKFVMPPGMSWELVLFIGMFFGGLLGALSGGTFKLRWNDDPTWKKIFGPQRWKRLVIGFLGAVVLQFGAGIAGGCTSGLAISGGMLLAPSAFLFMGGMFASGILVTWLIYRKRY